VYVKFAYIPRHFCFVFTQIVPSTISNPQNVTDVTFPLCCVDDVTTNATFCFDVASGVEPTTLTSTRESQLFCKQGNFYLRIFFSLKPTTRYPGGARSHDPFQSPRWQAETILKDHAARALPKNNYKPLVRCLIMQTELQDPELFLNDPILSPTYIF
jgi:hypothetical protein